MKNEMIEQPKQGSLDELYDNLCRSIENAYKLRVRLEEFTDRMENFIPILPPQPQPCDKPEVAIKETKNLFRKINDLNDILNDLHANISILESL